MKRFTRACVSVMSFVFAFTAAASLVNGDFLGFGISIALAIWAGEYFYDMPSAAGSLRKWLSEKF